MGTFKTVLDYVEFCFWMLSPIVVVGFLLLALSLGVEGERERLEHRKQSVSATR